MTVIDPIAGVRPNSVKVAPIIAAIKQRARDLWPYFNLFAPCSFVL